MKSKTSEEIINKFIKFCEEKGFAFYHNKDLIPSQESKLLFNISGGVKYQEMTDGKIAPSEKNIESKIATIQSCIRTDGINKIGKSGRHHMFFEMLGHFLFYESNEKLSKEESIVFAYDFLTKILELDKDRLYFTVHPEDKVTYDTLAEILGDLKQKNIILNEENTYTSKSADKSALRTEILWLSDTNDKETLTELWNIVFTQFDSEKPFENPTELIAVDSGASLERLVTALENQRGELVGPHNNYENSMWLPFINDIRKINPEIKTTDAQRIADYINTVFKLIDANIKPSNKVQGHKLRGFLRDLFTDCIQYNIKFKNLAESYMKYEDLENSQEYFENIITDELKKYENNCKRGIKILYKLYDSGKLYDNNGNLSVSAEEFYNTYGLPVPIFNLIVKRLQERSTGEKSDTSKIGRGIEERE